MCIDSETQSLGSPQSWTLIFMLASYLVGLAATFGAVIKGLAVASASRRVHGVIEQLAVLLLLIGAFWGLESLAHLRAPYYIYSSTFADLVPRAPWPATWAAKLANPCAKIVASSSGVIPLSVVVLEGSLTYSAFWTARLLKVTAWVQPLFAGITMFLIDVLLDPVVAMGHACTTQALPDVGNGLGLWHWFMPQVADLAGTQDHPLSHFFHVPLFNYAAWLGAPVIALSLINIGPFTRDWAVPMVKNAWARRQGQAEQESPKDGEQHLKLAAAFVVAASLFLFIAVGPAQNPSETLQIVLVLGAAVAAVTFLALELGKFKSVERVDATLTTPVALALAVPAAAWLIGGQFVSRPWLMPVAVITLAGGLWLGWLPYSQALQQFRRRLAACDAFVRLHYFGFTAMMVLLGASFFDKAPTILGMLALLLLAAAFHVFSYVMNDLVDLSHDRGQPLRKNDPLVSGAISVPVAVALTITSVPCAFLAAFHLQGFRLSCGWCFFVLAGAFGCMSLYNLYGKRCPWPWVTDLLQGAAWGMLSLVGASTRATEQAPISLAGAWQRCDLLFCYALVFILLINGIHGGLRDLANDRAGKKKTLARSLGAVDEDGQVVSTWKIVAFAMLMQALLIALVVWFLYRETHTAGAEYASSTGLAVVIVMCVIAFALSAYQLWHVVRIREPRRNGWISWNLAVLLAPPIIVFWGAASVGLVFKITATLCFSVPLVFQDEFVGGFLEWAYDRGDGQSLIRRLLSGQRGVRRPRLPSCEAVEAPSLQALAPRS